MATLDPTFLAVPSRVLALIPPRPFRFDANPREVFKRHTGLAFDAMAPPEAAVGLTLRMILNPERCARLVSQKALDPRLPDLNDVFEQLHTSVVTSPLLKNAEYVGEIARLTERMYIDGLVRLATNKDAGGSVRAATHEAILRIKDSKVTAVAHGNRYINWIIGQYLSDPDRTVPASALTPPDGAPIDPGQEWLSPDCDWQR